MSNKIQLWETMSTQLAQATDALGRGIDSGIFETVVILQLLGFTTEQSCEGHMDHGKCAPWVTLISPTHEIYDEAAQLYQQGDVSHAKASKEEAYALYQQAQQMKNRADALHAQEIQKLLTYLHSFYRDRHVAYDCRLILYSDIPGTSTLESQGASFQIALPLTQQEQKLLEYRQEMRAFTIFLKNAFFEEQTLDSALPQAQLS
jgi:hypothetical protein